jgi:hypothetical protein
MILVVNDQDTGGSACTSKDAGILVRGDLHSGTPRFRSSELKTQDQSPKHKLKTVGDLSHSGAQKNFPREAAPAFNQKHNRSAFIISVR